MYALRANGEELEQLSVVEGLGAGEQIYAVRFLGPTAYVVTFRQTDPLYVIDMTDPANPALTGELKIPGYSAYLHPVGDGLLLGVGQDATDTGQTLGTQLSLFDVSDPANPQRISTLAIGGWSDVEWDHKAFLFWPEDGTIVLPVSPGWGNCGPQVECLASQISGSGGGAVVARLDGQTLVGSARSTTSPAARAAAGTRSSARSPSATSWPRSASTRSSSRTAPTSASATASRGATPTSTAATGTWRADGRR